MPPVPARVQSQQVAADDVQFPSAPVASRGLQFLLPVTVFLGAFLLFLLEPLFAKLILPRFGGSAAVWATCLVFFQSALLLGYWYADVSTRRLPLARQSGLHVALLVVSFCFLPVAPRAIFHARDASYPAAQVLIVTTASIGLPFVLLSATSP